MNRRYGSIPTTRPPSIITFSRGSTLGQNRISLAEQNAFEFESYGCELAQESRISLDRLGHFHAVDAFDNLLQENEIHRSVYLIQIAFTDAELLQQ